MVWQRASYANDQKCRQDVTLQTASCTCTVLFFLKFFKVLVPTIGDISEYILPPANSVEIAGTS